MVNELPTIKPVVGRAREKQRLVDALNSGRSELVAVYGRRRIGKTYLIREFYRSRTVFSFTGLSEGNRDAQVKNFMLKLGEYTEAFKDKRPKDWLDAFALLKKYLKSLRKSKKKKVIFIDEFPWVDSHRSGFLPAFENFWNDYCTTRQDLVVVVCGSAAAYMVKKIIRNKRGLYRRVTQSIHLQPFTLGEAKALLKKNGVLMNEYETLKLYMALGGVAEYLEHVKPGESAAMAIQHLCFEKGAQLQDEYDQVFQSLFDEDSHHQQIMDALAEGKKKGLTRDELLASIGIKSGGRFSKALNDLLLSGFVLQYEAYNGHLKSTLFRICDEFCLFYLKFMLPNKGSKWTQMFQQQAYKTWCGYSFETICLKHVEEIKKGLKCDQIQSNNYSWHNKNAQIDLVIDRVDGVANLCELKFYNEEFVLDKNYSQALRKKENEFRKATKTKKALYTAMVTTWGVAQNEHSIGVVSNDVRIGFLFG